MYQNTLEFAQSLDKKDPLRKYREEFHFPQHEGRDVIYFTGNSLGLQPKSVVDLRRSSGDEFKERDIIRILIEFGNREWKTGETIAVFVLSNMVELIEEFDNKLYARVVQLYAEALEDEHAVIDVAFFITHPDQEIAQLAAHLVADREQYVYSPGWERLNVFLNTQKMPDENHLRDAKESIIRFKMRKVDRIAGKNQASIKKHQAEKGAIEELMFLLKVEMKLKTLRNELATSLGTVVIK